MKRPRRPAVDVRTEHHGSLYLLRPQTEAARAWMSANTAPDALYFAGALVVEPRYAADILAGLREDGLVVQ